MARIFISHSSRNNPEAVVLRDWLVGQGWRKEDFFLDLDPQDGIVAGERWQRALNDAANRCEAVVFLVSRHWLASDWCLREFNLAFRLNKRMFGLLIEDIAKSDLPPQLRDSWQVVSLAGGTDHQMLHAALPDGREGHVTFSKSGLLRLKNGLRKAGLDPSVFDWPPEGDPDRPPYRGLRPLEAEDAGIFLGREAPIVEVLDRLRGLSDAAPPRIFVVLGASGAGKSSFLRAGLLPRLRRDEETFATLPIVRPERAALFGETGFLRSLEQGVREAGLKRSRADLKAAIGAGAARVRMLLDEMEEAHHRRRVGEEPRGRGRIVLPIDQGEELFLAEGAEEAQVFLGLATELACETNSPLILLVTIRSDSFEALQTAPAVDGVALQAFSLPPMPRGAYQTVIEGPPARLAETPRALKIEPALTSALLTDIEAGGGKDALPLLAFTLERLYLEHGGTGDLKLSDYRQIGGIRGSIEAAVEGALAAADRDPAVPRDRSARLALLRRALIPWLAGIDPETGAPRRRVARLSEIPEETRPLVQHLIAARLLSTDVAPETGERTIEPAHEALLRQWGLLENWLEQDLAALTTLEGVRRAARDWAANDRSEAWLAHAAGRLEDAEAVARRDDFGRMLEPTDREYLEACHAREAELWAEAERRRRERKEEQARRLADAEAIKAQLAAAKLSESRFLTHRAHAANKDGDPDLASAIALAGLPADMRVPDRPVWPELVSFLAEIRRENRQVRVLRAGERGVKCAAWSSDGLRLAMSWSSNIAVIASVLLSDQPVLFRGHTDTINSIAWSPDGARIVTASTDTTARVWDSRSGEQLFVLDGHTDCVNCVAWSPDGARISTASDDKTARVWDAAGGGQILVTGRHASEVTGVAWSHDNARIATAFSNIVRVWDAAVEKPLLEAAGEPLLEFEGHADTVNSVAWSPDGSKIVTASDDGTAQVWDGTTGEGCIIFDIHCQIKSAEWSPDGTNILTASMDQARLWDVATGKTLIVLAGHSSSVDCASWNPDGKHIATASYYDRTVRIWNVSAAHVPDLLNVNAASSQSVAWSPDGKRIAIASTDKTARVWDLASKKEVKGLAGHAAALYRAAWSPDGKFIVTASSDRSARIWDGVTGEGLAVLRGHSAEVLSAAWSPDGTRIITASSDNTVRVWNAQSGVSLLALAGHSAIVHTAAWSPDGKFIVTASSDRSARIWDGVTGEGLAVLRGHSGEVLSADWSPDGTRILTASSDTTARIWDPNTGKIAMLLDGHRGRLYGAAWSPDGTRVVTISNDATVRIWDATVGATLEILDEPAPVYGSDWSPDGKQLATALSDGTARIREVWPLLAADTVAYFRASTPRILTAAERKNLYLSDPSQDVPASAAAAHRDLPDAPAGMSIDALKNAAASGNGFAHVTLAGAYQDGNGIERDLEKALFHWAVSVRLFKGDDAKLAICSLACATLARALDPKTVAQAFYNAQDWRPVRW